MYIIARHEGERITMLGGQVEIKLLSVSGKTARLGFTAPKGVDIIRIKENELQAESKTYNKE